MRAGIRALLAESGLETADDVAPGAGWAAEVEVVVADPGQDIEGTLSALAEELPGVPVIVLAGDPVEYAGLSPGQSVPAGWLLRDATARELAAAVHAVASGLTVIDPEAATPAPRRLADVPPDREVSPPLEALTERESQVLALMALGLPNKTIALRLGISEHTAKYHVGEILAKLEASSRTEAVTAAVRRGLLAL
jgi:DNA-binding NarL/FixJ family response regulator